MLAALVSRAHDGEHAAYGNTKLYPERYRTLPPSLLDTNISSDYSDRMDTCPCCQTPLGHTTEFRRRQALAMLVSAFLVGATAWAVLWDILEHRVRQRV